MKGEGSRQLVDSHGRQLRGGAVKGRASALGSDPSAAAGWGVGGGLRASVFSL